AASAPRVPVARLRVPAAVYRLARRSFWAGLFLGHRLLAGTPPRRVPLDDLHLGAADGQAPSRHIFGRYGISGRGRIAADPHRRDKDRVARDVGAIVDFGDILLESIPVGGDG